MAVLIIFRRAQNMFFCSVFLQTVINLIMLSIGGQGVSLDSMAYMLLN